MKVNKENGKKVTCNFNVASGAAPLQKKSFKNLTFFRRKTFIPKCSKKSLALSFAAQIRQNPFLHHHLHSIHITLLACLSVCPSVSRVERVQISSLLLSISTKTFWLASEYRGRQSFSFAKWATPGLFLFIFVLLDLTKQIKLLFTQHKQSSWIQTCSQPYSDTSP